MATSDQRCPRCGRPFTAGEVTGFGFLRSRPERRGGPLVEFTCPTCNTSLRLVPHGHSRYAFPGMPPPPAVPEADRAPPWLRGTSAPHAVHEAVAEHDEPPDPEPIPDPGPPAGSTASEETPRDPLEAEGDPMGIEEAREILGVSSDATAHDLEEAFRKRSRTCHPDKVAHLDREFQELANRKFDRLRRAFERLHE